LRAHAEPIAEGRPVLALRDEDREAIAELLAEALIAALEREGVAEALANAAKHGAQS
jgi:hypothetical protein